LQLEGDLWGRARAYEGTLRAASWWWPHRHFVMVSERPTVIERELVNAARPRGWGSHRLHCETGPAIAWPDGWGLWYWHGVPVSQHVIETPGTITVAQIESETNAEVRRVLIERYGPARYITDSGAEVIDCVALDDTRVPFGVRGARLLRKQVDGDEPLVMIELRNSTPEDDGRRKTYLLRVPPDMLSALAAVAWTCGKVESEYAPTIET